MEIVITPTSSDVDRPLARHFTDELSAKWSLGRERAGTLPNGRRSPSRDTAARTSRFFGDLDGPAVDV